MKACKECSYLFEDDDVCPLCGSRDVTDKYGGRVYIVNPEKSEIGQLLKVKTKGTYVVRVK